MSVTDLHSHLMPGVDDGAADLAQSRAALALMRAQGIRTVVTTPHLSGALTERPERLSEFLGTVDAAWAQLESLATAEFPDLRVLRGLEIMLDTPTPDLSDPRVRLGGTNFVLIEFPFMTVPPNGGPVLFELKINGWRPIIAHPERYRNLSDIEVVDDWRSVGGLLQVNAGSLLGKYGQTAEKLAWSLIERGWVDYLSSDYHARGSLHTAEALRAIRSRAGDEVARRLSEENPARLLRGEDPLEVPSVEIKRSIWRGLLGRRG